LFRPFSVSGSNGAESDPRIVHLHHPQLHTQRVEKAVQGESFIISKAGKPLVRVTRVEAPTQTIRTGFLQGQLTVPDDFDAMGAKQIAALFAGSK
jgi:antitoxin (DNA-binding transcriptional repressor) of toxin-antitoxin stability system